MISLLRTLLHCQQPIKLARYGNTGKLKHGYYERFNILLLQKGNIRICSLVQTKCLITINNNKRWYATNPKYTEIS